MKPSDGPRTVRAQNLQKGDKFIERYYKRGRILEVTGNVTVTSQGVVVPVRWAGETWLKYDEEMEMFDGA